ncbi:glycerate kinase family protein [Ferdinandcohnia quinoae]|uniref:glycerate kinase family protein n=1 Tax=Fredinandcohnia quinoae TaxID=2918902 RepID=UPI0031F5492A
MLIAVDSFKGSLTSIECSEAIKEGIQAVSKNAEILSVPLADGGEGTVEALVHSTRGIFVEKEVTGPLGAKVHATYGILGTGHTAVIEVAAACGLPLVPEGERNPSITTTYGVGELILDAINRGCRDFVIGLGGSATNDAGVGMLQALGFSFQNKQQKEIGCGGGELTKIRTINTSRAHPALRECTFKVACDVNNPLHGLNGAAYIFGPQKGATSEMIKSLDQGLMHFAELVSSVLIKNIQQIEGAGAAGGLGAAFAGFLNGQLLSGIDLILNTLGMEAKIESVNIVITGEGKLDGQTSLGKAPLGVARLAAKRGIPVIALAGGVTKQASTLNELGITSYFSIVNEPMSLGEAMDPKVAYDNLKMTTAQLFRLIFAMKK